VILRIKGDVEDMHRERKIDEARPLMRKERMGCE
jgi:hypothetical protein